MKKSPAPAPAQVRDLHREISKAIASGRHEMAELSRATDVLIEQITLFEVSLNQLRKILA